MPASSSQGPRRVHVTFPGLLAESVRIRRNEFVYPAFSPFGLELICFDLRGRHEHWLTQPWANDLPFVQDAIDREIVRHYRPNSPRNSSLMYQLLDLAEGLRAAPATEPALGAFASQREHIWVPLRLVPLIKIRWRELGYESVSAYVTGLIRYDLMLSGPHTYFNGEDKCPELLEAMDIETETEFHARRKRRILLDYLIEQAAGRKLTDDERKAEILRIAEKLRTNALRSQRLARGARVASDN